MIYDDFHLTLFGKEISGCMVSLHKRGAIQYGHVEEGVLVHHTRLILF